MKIIQKRFLAFLFACIPARLLIAWIAKKVPNNYLPYLGLLALLPATGFLYIYLSGIRKTGGGIFGQKIWWNKLRPVHAFMFYLFAYLAFHKNKKAYLVLFTDAMFGLVSFLIYHYTVGSFSKLFK
jgi:hypothetical protein